MSPISPNYAVADVGGRLLRLTLRVIINRKIARCVHMLTSAGPRVHITYVCHKNNQDKQETNPV